MLDLVYLARFEWLARPTRKISTGRFRETEYHAMQRAADGAAAIAMAKQRRRAADEGPQETAGRDRTRPLSPRLQ
jgi:hypothetical protein